MIIIIPYFNSKAFQCQIQYAALPIYHIWHSNSVHKYNPQKLQLQPVTMDMCVHCSQLQCVARDVRTYVRVSIIQQISYCTGFSCAICMVTGNGTT